MQYLQYNVCANTELIIEFLEEEPAFQEFIGRKMLEAKGGIGVWFSTGGYIPDRYELNIPVQPLTACELRDAISNGEYSKVMVYTSEAGAPILGQTDAFDQTVLHWAVLKNAVPLFEPLIKYMREADILKQSKGMQTALHYAIYGSLETSAFIDAMIKLRPDVLRQLANTGDESGILPLYYAAASRGCTITEILYHYTDPARLTDFDSNGLSLLHLAITNSHEGLTRLLMSDSDLAKKLVAIRDPRDDSTILHLAASIGTVTDIELLTSDAELIGLVDAKGLTPLHIAVQRDNIDICRALCERMSSKQFCVQTVDDGHTVLHAAVQAGNIEIVRVISDAYTNKVRLEQLVDTTA